MKRHANAPHHAAHDLAMRGLGVKDAAGRNRVDDARHADDAELLIYHDLGEDGRMCVVRHRVVLCEVGGFLLLDAIHRVMPHGVHDRDRERNVRLVHQLAVREGDLAS